MRKGDALRANAALKVGDMVLTHTGEVGRIDREDKTRSKRWHVLMSPQYGGMYFDFELTKLVPAALSVEQAACPCTTFEQDESCPVGQPSLLCAACDGKGIARAETVIALAAEMMKVAEQVDELEDPFAAWESIELLKSQASAIIRLPWQKQPDGDFWRAEVIGHVYEIHDDEMADYKKRQCQYDFEARIRSVLVPPALAAEASAG